MKTPDKQISLDEYRYFGIFVYRTMSKDSGLGIKKMIGPLRTSWSEVYSSMLSYFPVERLEQISNGVMLGIPPLTLQIMTSDVELTDKQVEKLKYNLLRDKHDVPIYKDNVYKIACTKIYSVMIDTPRESEGETAEIVGHQLLSGSRDCELLEIVRVHESSAEMVRQFLLTGEMEK